MDLDPAKASPYTRPLKENEIRLFRLFKFDDGSISGDLQHFHLEHCPRFIATSYVWGDRDETRPIQLNGHTVEILKTSHQFFQEMLAPDHYDQFPPSNTWWWMDCICINQDDPLERSVQVGLMSAIYQSALKTVIWLGEESDDSNVGMGFLKLLAEDWIVTHGDSTYWRSKIHPHIAQNSRGWKAIENLLTRKWWERVWTLQEFLLSRDASFFCGSKRISLDQMAYAIHAVWEWHQRHDRSIISRRGYEKGWNRIRMLEWHDNSIRHASHLPLVGILTYTATSSVTDPRDRLYSLLGLISPFELNIIGRPDYESDASSIYVNFAVSFITRYRNLDLLCIAPEMKENLLLDEAERGLVDLPSWVPDWSLRRSQSPPILCMASQSANPHIGNFRPLHSLKYYQEYCASGPRSASAPDFSVLFSEDLKQLTCVGIILDEIDGLGGGQAAAAGVGSEEEVHIAEMVQSTSTVNTTKPGVHAPSSPNLPDDQESAAVILGIAITEQITRSLTLDRKDPYLAKAAPVQAFAREFRRICRQAEGEPVRLLNSPKAPLLEPETDAPDSTAEISCWFQLNKALRVRGLTLEEAVVAGTENGVAVDERTSGSRRPSRHQGTSGGHRSADKSPNPRWSRQTGHPGRQNRKESEENSSFDQVQDQRAVAVVEILPSETASEEVMGEWCRDKGKWQVQESLPRIVGPKWTEGMDKSSDHHDGDADGVGGSDHGAHTCTHPVPGTLVHAEINTLHGRDREHEQRQAIRFATRFRSTTFRRGKRLMVTKTGILGMAPRLARKGDVVCVLLGCSIPLVLRPVERMEETDAGGSIWVDTSQKGGWGGNNEVDKSSVARDKREGTRRYTVIGEAYVDGYMSGEVVNEVDRGLRMVEDLKIV